MKNLQDYFHTFDNVDIINKFIKYGLYVTVNEDGSIKRNLITETGEEEFPLTTIKDEIIEFSELNFEPFCYIIECLEGFADALNQEDEDAPPTEENIITFKKFTDLYENLMKVFYEDGDTIRAILIRSATHDNLPVDDGSFAYMKTATESLLEILNDIVEFNLFVNDVFYNIHTKNTIDDEGKHFFMSQVIFLQELTFENGLTSRYLFRSVTSYYVFLLMQFLAQEPNITRCSCCGKYFVPKTKKATKYCDRTIKDGKTCKDIAPRLKHKIAAQNDEVISEFDRIQHNIYQRANLSCDYNEYWKWSTAATKARNEYLNGLLSKEEALKIIRHED